jgi:hypothetical protein
MLGSHNLSSEQDSPPLSGALDNEVGLNPFRVDFGENTPATEIADVFAWKSVLSNPKSKVVGSKCAL